MDKRTKEFPKQEEKWYLIDATNKVLGRLATKIAYILMGKHKTTYSPSYIGGDYVVVLNASKVKLTGKKITQKKYYRHSGNLGNLKEFSAKYMIEKNPEELLRLVVSKMLPKNKLRERMLKRLKIYSNDQHNHTAQRLQTLEV
ncbi:MAG: 50S ribosomal protein L13 [Candidatus Calescibacterium sp.]|nr:50S ribosomal protein L13 [Candidatus Calescibacterium sp.]MDW8132658.1 50S ribosomal protein L13 [Candidatus Calescibacterium sp.]